MLMAPASLRCLAHLRISQGTPRAHSMDHVVIPICREMRAPYAAADGRVHFLVEAPCTAVTGRSSGNHVKHGIRIDTLHITHYNIRANALSIHQNSGIRF